MMTTGVLPLATGSKTPGGDRNDTLAQIRMSATLRQEAGEEAERMGVSFSDFVRMALNQLIARIRRERDSDGGS